MNPFDDVFELSASSSPTFPGIGTNPNSLRRVAHAKAADLEGRRRTQLVFSDDLRPR